MTTTSIIGTTLTEITNTTITNIRREQRARLEVELERYETIIQDSEKQYQEGLIQLRQCFADHKYNSIPVIDIIEEYFKFKTEKTLRDITYNVNALRTNLLSRRRRFMATQLKIDPSPEVIIDSSDVSFKLEQIAYLSRGIEFVIDF